MCYQEIGIAILAALVIMYSLKELNKMEKFAMQAPPHQYISSIQGANPTVQGVTIQNPNNVFKISSLNAGMLDKDSIADLFPYNQCKGVNAYQADKAVVYDSLELSPTLEAERLRLANALAGTNFTVPNNRLWYSRKNLQDLDQPGLSANQIEAKGIYSCF